MKISDRLKEQRKIKGLTQTAIAKVVGVSKVAVSRWELGYSQPKGDKLNKLCNLLDCSPKWLLSGNKEECENVVMVNFYSDVTVAEGIGCFETVEKNDRIAIPKKAYENQSDNSEVCCIRVSGKSMLPVLDDGSIIAFNPQKKKIRDGMMYVIRQNNLLRVKLLIETPEIIIIRSYSNDFSDEIYSKSENLDLNIIGQVFWYSTCLDV